MSSSSCCPFPSNCPAFQRLTVISARVRAVYSVELRLHSRQTRASSMHCNCAMSQQQYLMTILAFLFVSASISGATRNRLLLSSESPPISQTINSILSKNVMVFSFGEKTQVPVPILNGAADVGSFSTPVAPSSNLNTQTSTILFACRAVGNQIYTTSALCLQDL